MKSPKTLVPLALMMIMIAVASVASAQYYHEEKLDKFLDGHPKVKSALEQNPNLINNKQWREKHPELQQFMQDHPDAWSKLPNSKRYGIYGPNHQWQDADGHHEQNPAKYQNHPDSAQEHPNSAANSEQNPEWSKHHEHEEAKEAKHRQQEEAKDAKHQQHEKADSEAKAERRHKHQGYGQN